MPIYKRCSRCGRRIPSGTTCECVIRLRKEQQKARYHEYDQQRRDPRAKEFYNSAEWLGARAAALSMDEGLDVYVFMTSGAVLYANTVHHIIPLSDDWSRRCDVGNLMSLHHSTHSSIEQKYKENKKTMQKELLAMLKRYRRGQQ
ncbi:MAG: HNH endonuclease [Clostridiales bacterium]|nr:HNH endonuclease [Clostridiales bacterium]